MRMEYLKLGMMKILSNIPIWNLTYPLMFGCFITNPLYLLILSTIISIHIILLAVNDCNYVDDKPIFYLLSFIGLLVVGYMVFRDFRKSSWVSSIKHKLLVKMGKRIPDNWDNEKL